MKKIIPIILILTIIISCCGCVNSDKSNKYSTSSQIQMAKDLLRDKYGEEFEISAIGGRYGTLSNTTYKVNCYPVNNPNIIFEAEIDKDGAYIYDEYISRTVCNKLVKEIKLELEPGVELFIETMQNLNLKAESADVAWDDLIDKNEKLSFVIDIVFTSDEDESDILNQLNSVLSTRTGFKGELRCYITDNKTDVERFSELAKENTTFVSDMKMLLANAEKKIYQIQNGVIDF